MNIMNMNSGASRCICRQTSLFACFHPDSHFDNQSCNHQTVLYCLWACACHTRTNMPLQTVQLLEKHIARL